MPYKTDTIKFDSKFLDKRIKLLPCQKEMVSWLYINKNSSITSLGKLFHVNKRLIQFILFPERKAKNLADRQERGGTKIYYNKEKNTSYMKKHRRRKHTILKSVQDNPIIC